MTNSSVFTCSLQIDGNDIDLTGRLAEFLDRLAGVVRDLQGPQTTTRWREALVRALDLLTATSEADAWQRGQALRELEEATRGGEDTELRLADVRAMLTHALAGRPSRANFRTGELTVCTMVPMRSVPHRVVVLLGLDDEMFPRTGSEDGDNVSGRDPAVGERDVRSEDRQLLLDAVMSAGEKLLLFYTGADPVTGTVKPPAIPLSELLDVVRTTCGRDIVVRHPLQPFDARNFRPDAPLSYDRAALDGARAVEREPVSPPSFLAAPLPLFLLSMLFEGTTFGLPDHVPSMTAVFSIAFLAYPTTVFNFAAWIFLLRAHAAATVTPFALLIPVFGMASTALVFGETLTPLAAAGSALIFLGLAINVFGWRLLR